MSEWKKALLMGLCLFGIGFCGFVTGFGAATKEPAVVGPQAIMAVVGYLFVGLLSATGAISLITPASNSKEEG